MVSFKGHSFNNSYVIVIACCLLRIIYIDPTDCIDRCSISTVYTVGCAITGLSIVLLKRERKIS